MSIEEVTHEKVRKHYAAYATGTASCCGASDSCTIPDVKQPPNEEPINLDVPSLGCGDPVMPARIQPGETVLDLGSGGGLDCFRAARLVGETGAVIGVDMTPEMVEKACQAAVRMGISNVDFRQGYLENMPVEDASVDAILSNCVVNLLPDKNPAFREMFRVLKPGGRISIADIVSDGPLPEALRVDDEAWCACVGGAIPVAEYSGGLRRAGFSEVEIRPDLSFGPISEANRKDYPYPALISARKPLS